MIAQRVADLIGHTPLLRLEVRGSQWELLLKLEKFNPGQSMKDRMALGMIEDAERSGRLGPGGTIIESSSGNTATGLAMLAAERGYRFIAVVDKHSSASKLQIIRAYGAQTVCVEAHEDALATKAREQLAEELMHSMPGSLWLRQADNPANSASYESTLAHEVLQQTEGRLDLLIGAVGTGGSLSGTGRALKATLPTLHVVGVEPVGSIIFGGPPALYLQSGAGTPGGVDIGKNVDYGVIDVGVTVTDAQAFTTARFLARQRGLLIGGCAGGVVYKAIELLRRRGSGRMVAIVPDGGEKYLDTVFDDEWIAQRGLNDAEADALLDGALGR